MSDFWNNTVNSYITCDALFDVLILSMINETKLLWITFLFHKILIMRNELNFFSSELENVHLIANGKNVSISIQNNYKFYIMSIVLAHANSEFGPVQLIFFSRWIFHGPLNNWARPIHGYPVLPR